jgi:hypothetical protein
MGSNPNRAWMYICFFFLTIVLTCVGKGLAKGSSSKEHDLHSARFAISNYFWTETGQTPNPSKEEKEEVEYLKRFGSILSVDSIVIGAVIGFRVLTTVVMKTTIFNGVIVHHRNKFIFYNSIAYFVKSVVFRHLSSGRFGQKKIYIYQAIVILYPRLGWDQVKKYGNRIFLRKRDLFQRLWCKNGLVNNRERS